jgi:hypothetical protein
MLQTLGSQYKDVSVHTQPALHGETLKENVAKKLKELERLKFEKEIELRTLKNLLEVRNISMPEVCFTLTSWELQLLSFFI